MDNSDSKPGKKGRPEHVKITRMLRSDIVPILRQRGFPFASVILNEQQIHAKLGHKNGREKGVKIPDAIICAKFIPFEEIQGIGNKERILIEIGNFVPDKWDDIPVIHIGFNKKVTPMLLMNSNFELETLKAIKEAIANDLSYSLEDKDLDELRNLVIFALIGSGLTNNQIANSYCGDFIEDNGHYYFKLIEEGEEELLEVEHHSGEIIKKYIQVRKDKGEIVKSAMLLMGSLRATKEDVGERILQRNLREIYKKII